MSETVRNFQNAIQNAATHKCKVHLPYPLDIPIPSSDPSAAPRTFRVEVNYKKKLEECQCNAVYQQYSSQQLTQAMERGRLSKLVPRFSIAPVNSDISYTTRVTPYSLTKFELETELKKSEKLPPYFNWADKSIGISPVYNQGMCGSCWAIATATCLSDVFSIQKDIENPNLSPTYLLSCKPQSRCGGGDPSEAVKSIQETGITSSSCTDENWCAPFTGCGGNPTINFDPATINTLIPTCSEKSCGKRYYISDAKLICVQPDLTDFSSEEKNIISNYFEKVDTAVSGLDYKQVQALIKSHIFINGPVIGGFHVFNNFFRDDFSETNQIYVETASYRGVPGVDYSDIQKSWAGSHAVVIVGWGKEKVQDEEVDYWIARNSWGISWGSEGYFKIAMYGNDPKKKFQNRFSQFEYPSIMISEDGIGLTGGVILITPGKIDEPLKESSTSLLYNPRIDNKILGKVVLTAVTIFFMRNIPVALLLAILIVVWGML